MRPFAALAALALVAGAAPLQAQELPSHCKREVVREERPLRGRAAREDSTRKAVRSAVLDDVRASARAAGLDAPRGIVLLVSDERRRQVEAYALDGDLPDSLAAEVGRRALPHLATYPGRGRVAMHLRLDSVATPPAVPGSRRVTCTPHLSNRLLIQQRMQAFASSVSHVVTTATSGRAASIGALLSRDGVVLHSEVMESSGDVRMDRFAADLAREMRFLPASMDGVTMDVWVVLPIRVLTPKGAARAGTWPRP